MNDNIHGAWSPERSFVKSALKVLIIITIMMIVELCK